MLKRRVLLTAFVVAILGLTAAPSINGWVGTPNRTTYLTFNGPVAIPGVTLPRGTYIFELAEPYSSIVRVMSSDRSQVYLTAFTNMVARPDDLPADRLVVFGESSATTARPVAVWYPVGFSEPGREFIYE